MAISLYGKMTTQQTEVSKPRRWFNISKNEFLGKQLFINTSRDDKPGLLHSGTAFRSIQYLTEAIQLEYWGTKLKFLKSFLNHTFMRLGLEEKIKGFVYDDFTMMIWNTGLTSRFYEPIFCILVPYGFKEVASVEREDIPNRDTWFIKAFATQSDLYKPLFTKNLLKSNISGELVDKLGIYFKENEELPSKAWYFSGCNIDQIIFNPSIPVCKSIDMHHLFGFTLEQQRKRRNRLPLKFRNDTEGVLAKKIKSGIETMINKITYNYRMAVPHYFVDKNAIKGEIQLLCPIHLIPEEYPDDECAISLKLSEGAKEYRIVALLSKDQAYSNARLLQHVDQEWLLLPQHKLVRNMKMEPSPLSSNGYTAGNDVRKISKKCEYYPNCRNGNQCQFLHI